MDDIRGIKKTKGQLEALTDFAAEAQAKEDARLSAIAKLQALGLTVDEVQVAFGLKT